MSLRCLALVAALLLAAAACTDDPPDGPATTTTTPASSAVAGAGQQTPGATDAKASGARGDGAGDDTAAFLKAQDAALASGVRFRDGPGGRPQAVVYVPPGTYRLLRLPFRSDVRMEVDAGAVLAQARGRDIEVKNDAPSLIEWDGPPGKALSNVSLVGVNSSSGGRKALADPLFTGWTVEGSFTFDLDPAATDANVAVTGIQALNVDGFLIQNVFSIENDSQPEAAPKEKDGWFPQSRKAALGLRGRSDTPADGTAFYDPHNGTIDNWYNVRGPKGFGPNQINSGHNLTFRHIFSRGGTTLRFETDASQGKPFGSELRGIRAEDIAGESCNRAVAFVPHAQANFDVHVSKVQAVGCSAGVLESFDETNAQTPGRFENSTITDITVTGNGRAQNSKRVSKGLWVVDTSEKAFAKDATTRKSWSVLYKGGIRCTGTFLEAPDQIMTERGLEAPACS